MTPSEIFWYVLPHAFVGASVLMGVYVWIAATIGWVQNTLDERKHR